MISGIVMIIKLRSFLCDRLWFEEKVLITLSFTVIRDLKNDAGSKHCWMFIKHAFEMLNVTPRYIFSYRWGYKVNGQWSGMINDISTNKAELGTNILIKNERWDVVSFTDVVSPLYALFVFRQPPLAYTSNIFSLPFSTNVWLALVVLVAAATLTLFCTSIWEITMERSPSQLDGSLSDALLLTLSAVAQQGCFIEPSRAPGRIMEWFLFTALMALYAAYSANIVVLLQAPSTSINTLAQLSASKITLAAVDLDYSRFILSPYKDPVRVKINRRIMPEGGQPIFYPMDEGVEKIRQGLFAFHALAEPTYRRIENTFLESEKCDLAEIDFVNTFSSYIPVKKDSPNLELLRVSFKLIRETGLLSAISKRLLVPKPKCVNRVSAFSSVGLLDMRPVIIFMLYGIAFSLLIFFAEVAIYKLGLKYQRKNRK
uniref:Ionotropic receptor n=1 Tax=Leucinodes orbonalis TaxID=711050 RepID=A0AAU0QK28_9NEOP|nr:ionotropic receptor [Leucinodes orbonalis]